MEYAKIKIKGELAFPNQLNKGVKIYFVKWTVKTKNNKDFTTSIKVVDFNDKNKILAKGTKVEIVGTLEKETFNEKETFFVNAEKIETSFID